MKQVTKITASSLPRVMSGCYGSVAHDVERVDQGDAAKEGDAFHELLLLKVKNQPIGTHASNGLPFDNDMHFYADGLLPYISPTSKAELKANITTRSGIQIAGRYDYAHVEEASNELVITDVKYGWGIVEAEKNWQLLSYAIHQFDELTRIRGRRFDTVTLRILQPRPHHVEGPIRSWSMTYEQFLVHVEELLTVTDAIAAGDTRLVTGEHCKYCPAARQACKAMNTVAANGIDIAFNEAVQDTLTNEEVAYLLFTIERAKDLLKIKSESLQELAKLRIGAGQIIPNYTMKPSYSDRKWNPGVTKEMIQMLSGIDVTETVMLSPAKAEKAGLPKELTKQLAKSEIKGMNLVRGDAGMEANKIFNNNKGGQ